MPQAHAEHFVGGELGIVRVEPIADERAAVQTDQMRPTGGLASRSFFFSHERIEDDFIVFVMVGRK